VRERHHTQDWRAVTQAQLDDFMRYLRREHRAERGTPLKEATISRIRGVVRAFFQWQYRRGRLISNPAERLVASKFESPLPRVLNEREMARLIEMPDIKTNLGLRDRALIEVLYLFCNFVLICSLRCSSSKGLRVR
jgi:site-specific recombinase XerD